MKPIQQITTLPAAVDQYVWPARPVGKYCWCGILAGLLLLSGCSLPGKSPAPARQTYALQLASSETRAETAQSRPCLSLRVAAPLSAPGYNTARIAYSEQPPRLDYFAYHAWVDSPARMLAALMEARLDSSGLLGAVVSGSTDIRTDLRLDVELKTLQQEFSDGHSSVRLVIKAGLINVPERSLLASRIFAYTEPASAANPVAGAAAANRAANRFLQELEAFVAEGIGPASCAVDKESD